MAESPGPIPDITPVPGPILGPGSGSTTVPSRPGPQPRVGTFSTSVTSSSSFSTRSGLGTSRRRASRPSNRTNHHRRRQPTEFLLPDGRKVLVALPEEAETLRRKFSNSSSPSDKQIEVVIHGSAEHRRFLYQTKAHHENRASELREKLKIHHDESLGGVHVLDEWEGLKRVIGEIGRHIGRVDSLSGESGKGVNGLKTNFSKFGYDAQLRTYGEDEEDEEDWEDYGVGNGTGVGGYDSSMTTTVTPTPAGTVTDGGGGKDGSGYTFGGSGGGGNGNGNGTVSGTGSSDGDDYEDYGGYYTMKLFQRPVVKQYFHRGLLWRASEATEVMSFELFFDLLYGMSRYFQFTSPVLPVYMEIA